MRIVIRVLFALTFASDLRLAKIWSTPSKLILRNKSAPTALLPTRFRKFAPEGPCCRTLNLGDPKIVSPCDNGARANKDKFTTSALGQKLIPKDPPDSFDSILKLDVFRQNPTDLKWICSASCFKSRCIEPNCIRVVRRNNETVFNIDLTLRILDSMGTLYLSWCENGKRLIRADRNYTLPEIVDDSNYNLTLTVHGPTELRTDNLCQFSKYVHTANIFQLCCPSSVTPCYAQIILGGNVVAKDKAPCVTYVPTSNSTVSMVLKYSLCTKTDYKIGGRCSMQSGRLTTIQTTAGPATASRLTTIQTTAGPATSRLTTIQTTAGPATTSKLTTTGTIANTTTTHGTAAGTSQVTAVTGPQTSTIDGGPQTSTVDGVPETSTIDDGLNTSTNDDDQETTGHGEVTDNGETTTDNDTLITSTSSPIESSSNSGVLFWIAVSVAALIVLIAILAYWMTHRKTKEPVEIVEQKPTVSDVIQASEPSEPAESIHTKEVEENFSEDIISLESESAVD